jgi:hypothetical protein
VILATLHTLAQNDRSEARSRLAQTLGCTATMSCRLAASDVALVEELRRERVETGWPGLYPSSRCG